MRQNVESTGRLVHGPVHEPTGWRGTATSPIGLQVIDGRRSRRFRQRLSSRLLASRSMIPMSIAQDESMDFSFFDVLMSGTSHSLPQLSLVLPLSLTSSVPFGPLIRFGCVYLSLCGKAIYINHVIIALSFANLTSNKPSTVMQTNNPQQVDHRRDTDPYIRPVQRCTTCHQVMGGLRVFEGSTPVNRHRRGSICQTVCIVGVVRHRFLIYILAVYKSWMSPHRIPYPRI